MFFRTLLMEKRLLHYTASQLAAMGVTPVSKTPTKQTYSQPVYIPPPLPTPTGTVAPTFQPNYVDPNSKLLTPTGYTSQEGREIRESQGQGSVNITDPQSALQYKLDQIKKNESNARNANDFALLEQQRQQALVEYNAALAKQQADQQAFTAKGQAQIAQGAATAAAGTPNPTNSAATFAAANLKDRLAKLPSRQAFIEQKRAEGVPDAQIRDLLAQMPTEASPATNAQTQASTAPSASSPTGKTTAKTTGVPGTPGAAPAPNPSTGMFRQMAEIETDPLMKIMLNGYADQLEAIGNPGDPMGQAAFEAGADAKAIAKPYDAIQKIMDDHRSFTMQSQATREEHLSQSFSRNEKYLAAQQASADAQLRFQQDKATRDLAEANRKKIDSQTIMLALQGGFGSSDGNMEIADARLKGEQALADLGKEFGFKRADVSLQFTQMHNDAFDKYQSAWLDAQNNFEANISNIDLQGISNQQAKSSALSTAYKTYVSDIKTAKKDYAKTITDATKMVYDARNEERTADRAQEQSVINQAQWAITTYGSGAKPFIEKLAKDNPKVNLAGLMGGETLTEANQNFDNQLALMKKIGGGGGSGLGFSSTLIKSGGILPSFDDYIADKEKQLGMTLSAQERGKYRKEYETKITVAQQYSPVAIGEFLDDRIKNISEQNVRVNAQKTVERYLSEGKYELAYDYVDGLGKNATATQQAAFSKAAVAKQQVNRLAALIDEVGTTGPGIGQLRSMNPFDSKVVEYKNLIRQTVPGLARGIFGEVGVLTDNDIKNYTATMANPSLTPDQARTATKNLLKTINLSVQAQLDIARASGTATRDLRPIFDSIPDYEFGSNAAPDPDEAYANSILQK